MKHWKLVLIMAFLLTFSTISYAETIVVKPRGDYATVQVEKSNAAFSILKGLKKGNKDRVAMDIKKNPGNFNPVALQQAGLYLIQKNELFEGCLLVRLAILRAVIDVEAANDPSLQDVIPILFRNMSGIGNRTNKTDLTNAMILATKKVIELDKTTPRNYDKRWACLHSARAFIPPYRITNFATGKAYQKIVNKHYSLLIETSYKDGVKIDPILKK
jgi:hypothetical protein